MPSAAAPVKVAPGGKGMSMEEILAAARGKKPAAQAPSVTAAPPPSAPAACTVTGTIEPCTTVRPLAAGLKMLAVGNVPVAVSMIGADATALLLSSNPIATN